MQLTDHLKNEHDTSYSQSNEFSLNNIKLPQDDNSKSCCQFRRTKFTKKTFLELIILNLLNCNTSNAKQKKLTYRAMKYCRTRFHEKTWDSVNLALLNYCKSNKTHKSCNTHRDVLNSARSGTCTSESDIACDEFNTNYVLLQIESGSARIPSNTLATRSLDRSAFIILDWDNTLFPTSWNEKLQLELTNKFANESTLLQNNKCLQFSERSLNSNRTLKFYPMLCWNSNLRIELRLTELEALNLLKACTNITSQLVIVTNATLQWVQLCRKYFYQKVNDFIDQNSIQILSARKLFTNEIEDKSYDIETQGAFWKTKLFMHLIPKLQFPIGVQPVICSIGDSDCERSALLCCLTEYPMLGLYMSIKFGNVATLTSLKDRMRFTARNLTAILARHENLDLVLE